ncbi:MAG: hypothetical protein IT200_00635 [Thermoleophilia bacterium]|nr:hypothetical protein [Thermoleophilia bacterium]
MSDDLDLGEAAEYILAERPKLGEDEVWAVLNELVTPPARGGDDLAVALLGGTHPHIRARTVRLIVREWRAYASIAVEDDWED